jgi:hypothetical protein
MNLEILQQKTVLKTLLAWATLKQSTPAHSYIYHSNSNTNISFKPLYSTVPYSTVPHRTVQYRSVPDRTVPYSTVPHRTVQYHTVPDRTVPYRTSHVRCALLLPPTFLCPSSLIFLFHGQHDSSYSININHINVGYEY